jgi:GGDEF domain-containing protein
MQSVLMAAAQAVTLDSPYDSVFQPLVDDLVEALSVDDPAVFLTAVEGRARLVAAERALLMADVFTALQLGLEAFRVELATVAPREALVAQRLGSLESEVLLRAGVGYAEGLEEVVERLDRAVAGLATTDRLTGLLSADEVVRRLAVELERCRRTAVSLGAILVAVVAEGAVRAADLNEFLRCSARTLAAGLRRYDVLGRAGDAEFVALLPDTSRHGVQAVLERLRPGLADECPAAQKIALCYAVAHLDVVDMGATDLLALLAAGTTEARAGAETVVWV